MSLPPLWFTPRHHVAVGTILSSGASPSSSHPSPLSPLVSLQDQVAMQNDDGEIVDIYMPRKWCAAKSVLPLPCLPRPVPPCHAHRTAGSGVLVPSPVLTFFFLLRGSTPCSSRVLHSSATNKVIGAKDHASVQINVAMVSSVQLSVNTQGWWCVVHRAPPPRWSARIASIHTPRRSNTNTTAPGLQVDPDTLRATGETTTYAMCGALRSMVRCNAKRAR